MKISYFVAYKFNKSGSIRFGNTVVVREKPITDYPELMNITKFIEDYEQVKEVVIINWQKFEKSIKRRKS